MLEVISPWNFQFYEPIISQFEMHFHKLELKESCSSWVPHFEKL
jgi:hypothetical protein